MISDKLPEKNIRQMDRIKYRLTVLIFTLCMDVLKFSTRDQYRPVIKINNNPVNEMIDTPVRCHRPAKSKKRFSK
jgi:hypothetical protein